MKQLEFRGEMVALGATGNRDEKYGNCIDSVVAMIVDSMISSKLGDTNSSGQGDGKNEGIMWPNKVTRDMVPTNSQLKDKGMNIMGEGFSKEGEEELEMGFVILEAKRRRSNLELEGNLGFQSDTSNMMEGVMKPKKGLAVGPVDL